MANEFVARKGIISSGSLTVAPLAGNADEVLSLTAAGTLQSAGFTSASMAASIAAAAGTFDLDFSADSGTNGSVDNSQTFAIVGGNGISTTSDGSQQLTISGVAGLVSGSAQIAIGDTTGTLAVNRGGTGQTSYTNGQILIGNSTGNTLAKQTLSGDVTMDKDGVVTIGNETVTYAKIQNVSATNRILGRDSAGAGDIEEIAPAALRTMINVEDGADVTDATNVKANLPANTVSSSAQLTTTAAGQVATANIADDAVTYDKIQNVAANSVLVRDANSVGSVSAKAVANTEILIGDGTGFTAAALSGDATMTNAGVVTVGKIEGVDITADEATQLANIGTTTISAAQWGYLGALDQGLTTTSDATFSSLAVSNDVTISGDLTVLGDAVELQVGQLRVEDLLITVASGSTTSAAANGAGIQIAGANASMTWNSNQSALEFSHTLLIPDYIAHDGDANNYIGFPAADTFIGATSGTERFRITSTGNFGIGTSSPTQTLTVAGNISGSGRLFLGTVDSNTTSIEALVLNGEEVEKRDLGTGAFVDVGNAATQDTGSMTVRQADLADSATSANTTAITNTTTGTGPYYLTFVDGTTGNKAQRVDSTGLTYNATSNALTATTFIGALSGNASTATNSSQLGGVTALGYVTTGSAAQDIAGVKTFTGGIEIETDTTNSTVALSSTYTGTIGSTAEDLHIYDVSDNAALFYDYTLQSTGGTSRGRAGSVIASYDRDHGVTFTEFSSGDIGGDTSDVVLNVVYASNQVKLQATNTTGDNFKAKVYVRTM